jgi:hypothetical protein
MMMVQDSAEVVRSVRISVDFIGRFRSGLRDVLDDDRDDEFLHRVKGGDGLWFPLGT